MQKHVVKHDLSPELAKKATLEAWKSYSTRFAKYEPTSEWVTADKANVAFKVKGVVVTGTLELVPHAIEMQLEVPFLFRPFRKLALEVVEEEIREWIGKAKAGEL
jgi:hypothetical protein